MPNIEPRKAQLNADIEEKLLFLAKLAARQKGYALVEFIEEALRAALSLEAMKGMHEAEPNVTEPTGPIQRRPTQTTALWMEGLWVDTGNPDKDAAARLFKAGTEDVNLLAPKQRTLFYHTITKLLKERKKVTPKNFIDFIDFSESGE
jgi:hypothetical protein